MAFAFVGWDDDIAVTRNALVTADWSRPLLVALFSGDTTLRFKPVHWLVVRSWYDLFGLEPSKWHALGLGLHAAAAVLAFLTLHKMLRISAPRAPAVGVVAWFGALFWAVHPLRVEPVAWVTASTYPLAAIFLLASFNSYLTAYQRGSASSRRRWLAVAWLLAVLAYGSYPVTLTYGLWLMAVDVAVLRIAPTAASTLNRPQGRHWWGKHLLFLAPGMLALGVTVWTRLITPGNYTAAPDLAAASITTRGLMAVASIGWFPAKCVWPTGLTPNHQSLKGDVWSDVTIVTSAAAVFMAFAVLFLARKRWRASGWICAGFVALSLPCLGLTEHPVWPVNRYSYVLDLVLIGGFAAGALHVLQRARRWRRLTAVVGAAVASLAVMLSAYSSTWLLPIWSDSDRLFMHMEADPQTKGSAAVRAHLYMLWARHAARERRVPGAVLRLNQAQRAYRSAIIDALRQKDYSGAVRLAQRLQADIGLTPSMQLERAGWLLELGRTAEAKQDLEEVMRATPADVRARELMGRAQADHSRTRPRMK